MAARKSYNGTVEICDHTYKLREVKGLKNEDGEALYGYYRPGKGEERSKYNTMLHEIAHGIMEHAGLRQHYHNEELAAAFAYGLVSVKVNGKPILRR
jgi:hypothetical protein